MRIHKHKEVESNNDETNESFLHMDKDEQPEELFLHIDNQGESVKEDTEEEKEEETD